MITIDIKLLENYFLINQNYNVKSFIEYKNDLIIKEDNIYQAFEYLQNIIKTDKQEDIVYVLETKQDLLNYIFEKMYFLSKHLKNIFYSNEEFELFIFVLVSLFFTRFSNNSLYLLKYLPNQIISKLDESFFKDINSYIDSYDARGLLFFLTKTYNIDFDIFSQKIEYEYKEPSINKQWQNKYKKDGFPIVFWFYESILGKGLFIVLYTPKCRYKLEKGGCAGCNLPSVSSSDKQVNENDIYNQISNTFKLLSTNEKNSIKEVILSNNGSILDSKTMSKKSLLFCIKETIINLPNLKKIILETRIDSYSDISQLIEIDKYLKENNYQIKLELAIGFEIFDDNLRNGFYKKGIDKKNLENKIKELSKVSVSLKVYMMFKAVLDKDMNVKQAIEDINKASEYFSKLATKYNININLHITPTYLVKGTILYKKFKSGEYTPPTINDIKELFNNLEIKDNLTYYLSINDEGIGEMFEITNNYYEYIELKREINRFNKEQYKSFL